MLIDSGTAKALGNYVEFPSTLANSSRVDSNK